MCAPLSLTYIFSCHLFSIQIQELPSPCSTDFTYYVYLVGPGPTRPTNPDLCLTADMCTPIFPNTSHPTGRAPVRPDPPFPFSNCAHWTGQDAALRVRVKRGRYPRGAALELPDEEYLKLERDRSEDDFRRRCLGEARRAMEKRNRAGSEDDEGAYTVNQWRRGSRQERDGRWGSEDSHLSPFVIGTLGPAEENPEEPLSVRSSSSRYSGGTSLTFASSDVPADLYAFGLDDGEDRRCYIPVVNLWLDLAAHVPAKDIPSPVEFVRQYEQVSRCASIPLSDVDNVSLTLKLDGQALEGV